MTFRLSLLLALLVPASLALAAPEPDLVGFEKVAPGVYRGGRVSRPEKMKALAQYGIHTIVNLQGAALKLIPGETENAIRKEREEAVRNGIRYYNIPFGTLRQLDEEEERGLIEIVRIMGDPQHQPVYVHCNIGADRTGVAIAAFRILQQNCSFDEAWRELVREGVIWTPLFSGPQASFLKELAADPVRFGFRRTAERCPL